MSHVIEIVEILEKSKQGMQSPYKCRGEDGKIYYVKGRQTNRASLWNEWIGASLGRSFGLNIPPFSLVNIREDVAIEAASIMTSLDIGVGVAFGSERANARWLEPGMCKQVSVGDQRDIIVFDWWIRNADRLLFNSNLLLTAIGEYPVVIDHNMAFDLKLKKVEFLSGHIFSDQWSEIEGDKEVSKVYTLKCYDALHASLEDAINRIPEDWYWENMERDIPVRISINEIRALLFRCEKMNDFWGDK